MQIDTGAVQILQRLEEAGFEAFVVGGCVRDALMGLKPKDWDITTSAHPEEVKQIFTKTFDTGIEHGTVSVWCSQAAYEVTTYRVDGAYTDHRRPDEVSYTSQLYEDLARRDFTINAMAYHPQRGLVDYFHGRQDLKEKRIRCVGRPEDRFEEDALRMLRAVRFAARLCFEIEPQTLAAIGQKAKGLSHVSKERIADELNQTLLSQNPAGLKVIADTGLAAYICPEIGQGTELDFEAPAKVEKSRVLRWAALLNRFGGQRADQALRQLKFDNATRQDAAWLLSYLKRALPDSRLEMRRFLSQLGTAYFPQLCALKQAVGTESSQELEAALELYRREKDCCVTLAQLAVSGRDLMAAGAEAGKQLGASLNWLLARVIEQPELNRRETLLELYRDKRKA